MTKAHTIAIGVGLTLIWSACSPGLKVEKPKPDVEQAKPMAEGFPKGWSAWEKFNDDPVVRDREARDLHYNAAAAGATSGAFPAGTTLVKAHYGASASGKGDLRKLSVMTKSSGAANGGWTYAVYSPDGQAVDFDKEACALCHAQRQANDYVFSNRSKL